MTAIDVTIVSRMVETNRSAATRLSRMLERSRHVPSTGRPPLSRRAVHHPVCPNCPKGPRLAPGVLNLPIPPVLDFPWARSRRGPKTISQHSPDHVVAPRGKYANTPSTEWRPRKYPEA